MWSRGHHHEFPCTSRHATPHVCFTQSFLRRGVFTTPTSHNHFCGHWRPIRQHHDQQRRVATCSYDGSTDGPSDAEILKMDSNQLQTALNVAIASEDYQLAAVLRDVLTRLMGDNPKPADWQQLGVLDWLAERAERLGFRYPTGVCGGCLQTYKKLSVCVCHTRSCAFTHMFLPTFSPTHTEIQKRTVPVVLDGNDTIIRSATGSGKTMSFMLPAISRLPFPPAIDLQDVTVCARGMHVYCVMHHVYTMHPPPPPPPPPPPHHHHHQLHISTCIPNPKTPTMPPSHFLRFPPKNRVPCVSYWYPRVSWVCKSSCQCTSCLVGV